MQPESPDILIVGAGPCGALMASRLTAKGFSVLALEAGPGIAARMRHSVNGPVYAAGLRTAAEFARERYGRELAELDATQVHALLGRLLESSPQFFRLLRSDVCALYLSDPGVWQRIGFPGPSADTGGYPDFDQPQV